MYYKKLQLATALLALAAFVSISAQVTTTTGVTYNVLDNGFVADNATANDAAWATLKTIIEGAGNAGKTVKVYWPRGAYKFSGAVTVNRSYVQFVGDGAGLTSIVATSLTSDLVSFIPPVLGGTNNLQYVGLKGIRLIHSGTNPTAGALLSVRDCRYSDFDDVALANGFGGLHIIGGGSNNFRKLQISTGANFSSFSVNSYGVLVDKSSGNTYPEPYFFMSALEAIGGAYSGNGLEINEADGIQLATAHIFGYRNNCYIYGVSSANIQGVAMSNVYLDGYDGVGNVQYNLLVAGDGTAVIKGIQTVNLVASGASYAGAIAGYQGHNISFQAPLSTCKFSNTISADGGNWNLFINSAADDISFDGLTLTGAGKNGSVTEVLVNDGSGISFSNVIATKGSYAPQVLLVQGSSSNVMVNGMLARNYIGNSLADTTTSGTNSYRNVVDVGLVAPPTIASDSTLHLYPYGETFLISGSTPVSNVTTAMWAGRTLQLKFLAACTVTNGSTLQLKGGSFTAAAGDSLSLWSDGSTFREFSRTNF